MKISVNWLNDYVDLSGITAREIADKMTQITCEVEEVIPVGRGLESVLVGKILTCTNHPQSDHLHLLTVDIGKKQPLAIVCGAPNARAGITVAVATVGTVMPNGMKIEPVKLRGYDSCGMCCSYAELGYKEENDGIIELPADTPLGTPITAVLAGLVDDIIDIDNKSITNRPDLWGHYGMARELSVIFDRPLRAVSISNIKNYAELPPLSIKIENDHCLAYGAVKVAGLGGAVSPDIIQNRLYKLGHNSHGLAVDLTNYLMLAFGNPLHAFDATKVDKLSIGSVTVGTEFTTLKDNQIVATKDMLFIKSNGKPVALAGVMGGKDSEITPDTQDAVFEIATFEATNIRRTSVAVGIRSDASMRYEKALDPETNWLAAAELLRLLKKYAPQATVVSSFTRVVNPKAVRPAQKIVVTKKQLCSFTGVDFTDQYDFVQRKLTALGFKPKLTSQDITVTVPSWRSWKDVTTPADVIEEIVRNYGYQNIKPVAPVAAIKPLPHDAYAAAREQIKDTLAWQYYFNEVHTLIWYDTKALKNMGLTPASYATIANPFYKDDNQIRSTMLPSLLTVAVNNKLQPVVRVFEIGRVINADGTESEHLAGVAVWMSYHDVAQILVGIFDRLGFKLDYKLKTLADPIFHPTNNAEIWCNGQRIGRIGKIHPRVINNADAVGFELNLSAVQWNNVPQNLAPVLSKFPKTELDFTFVWNGIYADLAAIMAGYQHPLVTNQRLTAVYENRYTLTFTVSGREKTLDKEEIQRIHQEIVDFAATNSVHLYQ